MASRQERDYLRHIAKRRADTVSFLSSDRKPEQERSACAAFLRGLGIPFLVAELKSVERGQDPPDIIFRDGRIEVCEHLNQGRRRHDEARAMAQQTQQAQTIDDVLLPRRGERTPLSLADAYNLVAEALANKCARRTYTAEVRAELDALVCIQLLDKFLRPALPLPPHDALFKQGWRSVSLIMDPYGHVIYATESAPAFLREYCGQTRKAWTDSLLDKLFSLEQDLDASALDTP
ncbi:MAG: DUF1780 domain-containing protein [Candidatus Entotheonellia bacterium]